MDEFHVMECDGAIHHSRMDILKVLCNPYQSVHLLVVAEDLKALRDGRATGGKKPGLALNQQI